MNIERCACYVQDTILKANHNGFNVEVLYLPDERFSQKEKHFRIVIGAPLSLEELAGVGSWQQVDYVRKKVCFRRGGLHAEEKSEFVR